MPRPVVTFVVADPGRRLAAVRLRPDVPIAGPLDFVRRGPRWELTAGQPPVARMEYLLDVSYQDGSTEVIPDPSNPLKADGAFGVKSVREFAGYEPPAWLRGPAEPGTGDALELPVPGLGQPIPVRTWSPADVKDDEPLPLLVVHDGPEYDELAGLTRYLAAGVTAGWLPRLRAALLGPGQRDRWYSASASYARALRRVVIPALAGRLATTARIGMGTSLGGLAMLHARYRHPDAFDALFLQSGSFFLPRFDSQEKWFPYYRRITEFVGRVHAGGLPGRPIRVVLTCGSAEENLANNRSMAGALRAHGHPADLHEVPDAHNYTAWRDALDPHLTRLLGQACR